MSKRPELTADLLGLAKKGEAKPSAGVPQRRSEDNLLLAETKPKLTRAKGQNTEQMIFRVSPALSLEFRRYAVEHRLKLNEVFEKAFETLKSEER